MHTTRRLYLAVNLESEAMKTSNLRYSFYYIITRPHNAEHQAMNLHGRENIKYLNMFRK